MKKTWSLVIFVISSLLLMAFVAFFALNFATIKDIIVGLSYHPTSEMTEIRDSLGLTAKGARIFNATLPELKEKEEFNQICRDIESANAILGCYRGDRVYVYNISSDELVGVREATAAHELLHAVYHRMSADEKREIRDALISVYQKNQETLGEEIDIYEDDKKEEELYVRAGTEIAELPEILERHYGAIFENQDLIAEYYQGYIKVFREIEQKLEDLLLEAQNLEANITAKTAQYESDVAALNAEVAEYNNCAVTKNCFSSVAAATARRNELTAKSDTVSAMYDELSSLVSSYNDLVREYNENLLHGQALNMVINSASTSVSQPE